jgi:hypothetical protein
MMMIRTVTYDGPGARLVRLNLLVALFALVPAISDIFVYFAFWSARLFGDAVMIPAVIAGFLLAAIGGAPFLVCFPILLACLFGHRLLRNPEIPQPVKKATFLFVGTALVIMLAHAALLYLQSRHGRFRMT